MEKSGILPNRMNLKYSNKITDKIRYIAVDWMFEVINDFEISIKAYHLAVIYLDFFNIEDVDMNCFQLLALTCLS